MSGADRRTPWGEVAIIVIAKEPVSGLSKTRLCPPCDPEQAAALARASLEDTLEVVATVPAARRVLALDGEAGPWLPQGFEVIPQRGDGLDERLAAAFEDTGCPALLVGMDTPQLSKASLTSALSALMSPGIGAVLGPAEDGGFWAIGLRAGDRGLLEGIPMSVAETGARQRERLEKYGLQVHMLERMRDVDLFPDALAAAAEAPHSRFAATLALTLERLGADA